MKKVIIITLAIISIFIIIESILKKDKDNIFDKMTLDEKIAQMLVLYYSNNEVDETLKNTIKTLNPGGFIIMNDNITTFDKTKKFIDDIKESSKITPIIAIDEEGGLVQRLINISDINVTEIPSMMKLGKTNDTNLACDLATIIAKRLKTLGVNTNFSPVLDLDLNENNTVISTRSFGKDQNLVSKMAISFANCLEKNDIMPVYKHFPGHGSTSTDSHIALPIIDKSYSELLDSDLFPFKEAINSNAKIIMIGHLALPQITNDNTPASLSKEIITDILKNDLGFNGLVITDALNMGALTENYSYEEIYTKAIEAGADLLLMPSSSKDAIKYIKENISEERINESVKKILKFKNKYLKNYELLDKSYLNKEEYNYTINKINE